MVSSATLWEMAIKQSSGKLRVPSDVIEGIERAGARLLDIRPDHACSGHKIEGLPHSERFHRLLIAQAASEEIVLMTADRKLLDYRGSPVIRLADPRL